MGIQKQNRIFGIIFAILLLAFIGSTACAWALRHEKKQREAEEPVISPATSCLLYGKFCEPDGVCFRCTVI